MFGIGAYMVCIKCALRLVLWCMQAYQNVWQEFVFAVNFALQ